MRQPPKLDYNLTRSWGRCPQLYYGGLSTHTVVAQYIAPLQASSTEMKHTQNKKAAGGVPAAFCLGSG